MNLLKRFIVPTGITLLAFGSLALSANASTTSYDATLAAPGYYNGTGNSSDFFTIGDQGNLELGLSAVDRFNHAIDPGAGSNNYVDGTGTTGTVGHELALWDYYYSINTQAAGGTDVLGAYTYWLTVTDVNTGDTIAYDPTVIPDDSGYGATGKTAGLNPAEWGAQNAENVGWSYVGFGGAAFGVTDLPTDEYAVVLQAFNGGTDAVDSTSITVNASESAAPEPGTIGLMLGGVAVVALFRRRLVS